MSQEHLLKKVNLRPDEEVAAVLHHHPITYLKQFLITAVLILLSFFLMFYLFSLGQLGAALFSALLFTGIFYGSREFYIWYNNIFIITTQRIIDIDQTGFFHKTVSEVTLEKILDISYYVHGILQTILNLGTIKITEPGASLILRNIKEVAKVNQVVTDLIREQTGKKIEVKKVKLLTPEAKDQLTEDFLNQDELAEYDDYKLSELIEDYKETFGELRLKKLLVAELEQVEEPEVKIEDRVEPKEETKAGKFVGGSALDNQAEILGDNNEEVELKVVKKFKNKRL
jgi:hypothetical protein